MTRSEILQIAKPILFNTDMVRAIRDGRKTVTRRIMKPQPIHESGFWKLGGAGWSDNIRRLHPVYGHSLYNRMPYKPGDVLYVRETYKRNMDGYSGIDFGGYIYKADCRSNFKDLYNPWRPSIHMPKEAARIFLRVTDVRVEQLQDITEEQAEAEGVTGYLTEGKFRVSPVCHFMEIWDDTIKKENIDLYGWIANPWVWVIGFERVEVEP